MLTSAGVLGGTVSKPPHQGDDDKVTDEAEHQPENQRGNHGDDAGIEALSNGIFAFFSRCETQQGWKDGQKGNTDEEECIEEDAHAR